MIRFVLADLRRLWLGAAVVVLLVSLAAALGVAVTLQERALRLGSARAADKFDLVIGAAGSETQLVLSSVFLQAAPLPLMPGTVLEKLLNDPRVDWAAPVGFGDSFGGYPVVGTTTALIDHASSGFSEGRMFEREGEAVIGSAVRLPLGAEIKPTHGMPEEGGHTHTELAYQVSGRLQPTGIPWDRAILVPIQAVWNIHGLEYRPAGEEDHDGHGDTHTAADLDEDHDHGEEHHAHDGHVHGPDAHAVLNEDFTAHSPGLPAILVKPKSIADAYKLRLEYRGGETVAVFPGEVLTRLYATLGDAKLVLASIAGGAQVLVAAALVLVTVIHIGQRRRQIGALRAFGAPRLVVSAIVWMELFLLMAVGIALGFAIGLMAVRVTADMLTAQSGVVLPVGFARQDIWAACILMLVAAILSTLPSLMAYRQSPASALRS